MIRIGIVGLGKMGLSHLAMINAHPDVKVAGVCDSSTYVLGVLSRYTGLRTYADLDDMLATAELDALIVSTPSRLHASMVRRGLERGLHVFCEKPFSLSPNDSEALAQHATDNGLVTQVGYHCRFIATFRLVKQLLESSAIGDISHVLAEAYGPVVLRPKGGTWRSQRTEGGGCLYDYAAHPIDLVSWYLGEPVAVGGTVLNRIFSKETDDEVYSTLHYPGGCSAQISANWSDESVRKMTTKITVWGTAGRIHADSQECQVFLRESAKVPEGFQLGWNVRYTTELTEPVWFYLRGEEYSAQLDHFVRRVQHRLLEGDNTFASAAATDRILASLVADAAHGPARPRAVMNERQHWSRWRRIFRGRRQLPLVSVNAGNGDS